MGNLLRESGVVERLSSTAQNELINLVTILLGLTVGGTMVADAFLDVDTLKIFGLGLVAFSLATAGGVIFGKVMYLASGRKVNPLLGAAGVSAVPMSARVVHRVALEANPNNYLVMHAMGPKRRGRLGICHRRRVHPEHGGLARHSANPNPAPPRRCRAIRSLGAVSSEAGSLAVHYGSSSPISRSSGEPSFQYCRPVISRAVTNDSMALICALAFCMIRVT